MNYFLTRLPIVMILFLSVSISYTQVESDSSVSVLSISENIEEEWFAPDSLTKILIRNHLCSDWRKIQIIDHLSPKYLNRYSFISKKNRIIILDSSDVKIRSVRKRKFDATINALINQVHISDSMYLYGIRTQDPLTQFGLDSNWYKSRILDLWSDYQNENSIELNPEQLEKTKVALMKYSRLNRILRFPNNWDKNESPMIDVNIIYDFGSLHFQATSYFPYMLDWYYFNNKTRLSNHKISILVAELLNNTKIKSDNINRLMGVNFESSLMDDIYKRFLLKEVL
jgi:hypothetical protein